MRLPENPPALAALPTELDPVRFAALLGQIDPLPPDLLAAWRGVPIGWVIVLVVVAVVVAVIVDRLI